MADSSRPLPKTLEDALRAIFAFQDRLARSLDRLDAKVDRLETRLDRAESQIRNLDR